MRVLALDRPVSWGGQVRAGEAQWADDASCYCAAPGAAGDPLDDQPQQVVVRAGVEEARAGREQRRLRGREIEELRDLPHLGGMTRDLFFDGGVFPFRDAAAVVEQHAHRDVGRGREAVDDARGQHLREPGVEGQPVALGELQNRDRDERLRDAPGPEPIGAAHRDIRRHAAEAGDAGKAAEPRAAYVQDCPGSGRARIAQRVAQRLLQLTGEGRVDARAGRSRQRRRRVPRRAQVRSARRRQRCRRRPPAASCGRTSGSPPRQQRVSSSTSGIPSPSLGTKRAAPVCARRSASGRL